MASKRWKISAKVMGSDWFDVGTFDIPEAEDPAGYVKFVAEVATAPEFVTDIQWASVYTVTDDEKSSTR